MLLMDIGDLLVPYAFETWTIEMRCRYAQVTEFGAILCVSNNKELEQNNLLVLQI
jgi:hypothetical protein